MKHGFSMIEFIIILVILSILMSIVIPKLVETKKAHNSEQFIITIFKQNQD